MDICVCDLLKPYVQVLEGFTVSQAETNESEASL